MKRSRLNAVCAALAALAFSLVANVAWACPMCFNGNNNNQAAFLYGSLFLMIVPVTAIGSLLYWAWKRSKALETPPAPPSPTQSEVGELDRPPALRLVRR